jgi:hypothetical protein
MIVASSNGLVQLSPDFADPLLCTYQCDGALEANEIQSRRYRMDRDLHGAKISHLKPLLPSAF